MNHDTGRYEVDSNTEPYTGVIVGVRADEEGSRSKERYFSPAIKITTGTSAISLRNSGDSIKPTSPRNSCPYPSPA